VKDAFTREMTGRKRGGRVEPVMWRREEVRSSLQEEEHASFGYGYS
jgi:hypothetical protein